MAILFPRCVCLTNIVIICVGPSCLVLLPGSVYGLASSCCVWINKNCHMKSRHKVDTLLLHCDPWEKYPIILTHFTRPGVLRRGKVKNVKNVNILEYHHIIALLGTTLRDAFWKVQIIFLVPLIAIREIAFKIQDFRQQHCICRIKPHARMFSVTPRYWDVVHLISQIINSKSCYMGDLVFYFALIGFKVRGT